MQKNIPAVSIIIPMYNSEKYIGECLDSVLAQTFDDYEVIVVDDCSTDESCKIVESYQSKFGDKLQLIQLEKNSGSGALPRNKGMEIARGEYILFVDSDDAIVKTALEVLFKSAEELQADVVHCGAFLKASENDSLSDYKNLKAAIGSSTILHVDKSSVFSDKLSDRVVNFGLGKFNTTPWNYFFRREFLLQNQITFPPLMHGEDEIFCFMAICNAKVFALIQNVFYIYRIRKGSVNRTKPPLEKHVHDWFGSTLKAIEIYENFMDKFPQFNENPNLKYMVFELFANHNVSKHIMPIYTKYPAPKIDALIRNELADVKDKTALTAFLFNRMNLFQVRLIQAQDKIAQLDAQIKELQK